MRVHSSTYKTNLCKLGRQTDSKIIYELDGETIELGKSELNSITPHYESQILKSAMKQLDIDSNVEIPIGTEINYKFGVKTRKGKNLLGLIIGKTDTVNGVTITITPDGYVKLHGTSNGNINKSYNWAIAGSTYSSKTYTYSSTYDSGTVSSNFVINARSGSTQTSTSNQFNPSSLYVNNTLRTTTFTASGSGYITGIQFIINNGVSFNNFIIKLQVEQGNIATEYEKYGKYEYLDFGKYIVYKSEKQEDTRSYKITCYDKMLYSMIPYEAMNITYPITIRNYISAICNHLGLIFANSSDTFANYDKVIDHELYLSYSETTQDYTEDMGYTFRDVFDELAQVTGSTICINNDDELEIRYINDTEDTIDEEYLKDINVNFGEKYGPVNSIVLSRAGDSDRIDLRDEESITENGLCEINISENQIMNFNDRNTYLPDLLETLDGLEYYLNDFSSTGITYYDMCDKYNVSIGENIYPCIMFNDQVNITQGLEENVYTEMPEESETDYTKADKTDRKINQTYIIVDKQKQVITSVVNQIGDRGSKQTTITEDIDGLQSQVEEEIIISKKVTNTGSITLQNAFETQLHKLVIKGNISVIEPQEGEYGYPLVPRDDLVPSNSLVPSNPVPHSEITVIDDSILMIDNVEYELDFDFLNYIDDNVCDKYVIEDGNCYVIRKIGIDSNGDKYAIDDEVIEPKAPISLVVNKNSTIRLKSTEDAILEATYLLDNPYTNSFTTNYEVKTEIKQAKDEINAQVVGNDEVVAKMNLALREGQGVIEFVGNQFLVQSDNFSLDRYGNMQCNNAKINGNLVTENGVLTNLIFPCETWGWFEPNTYYEQGGSFIGFNFNLNRTGVTKSYLNFTVRIPENFVVVDARIHLRHSPVTWSNPENPSETQKGSCKNLKVYSVANLGTTGYGNYESEYFIGGNSPTFTEITEVSSFSFGDSNFETYSTENFKDVFSQAGSYNIAIATTTSTPGLPMYYNAYYYLGRHTGILNGELEIIGYKKFNQVGSSNRSLSNLNQQNEIELRNNETELNEEKNNEQTRTINQQLEIDNTNLDNKEKENNVEESDI